MLQENFVDHALQRAEIVVDHVERAETRGEWLDLRSLNIALNIFRVAATLCIEIRRAPDPRVFGVEFAKGWMMISLRKLQEVAEAKQWHSSLPRFSELAKRLGATQVVA